MDNKMDKIHTALKFQDGFINMNGSGKTMKLSQIENCEVTGKS